MTLFCIHALDSKAFASLYKCWCSVKKCRNMTLWCVATFLSCYQRKIFILVFLWFPKNYHSWQRGKKKKQKPLTEEINSSMSAQYRCVSLRNVSTAAQEVWGLRRGQSRAKSRLPWPLCGQLGQAPFLRKQPSPGSSPPFVVLPTRWSVEVSVVTEPVCNRLVFHGPV